MLRKLGSAAHRRLSNLFLPFPAVSSQYSKALQPLELPGGFTFQLPYKITTVFERHLNSKLNSSKRFKCKVRKFDGYPIMFKMASFKLLLVLLVGSLASMPTSTLNIGIVVSEKTDSSVVTKLDNELDRAIN
jgi:hypothetical protein